MKSKYVLASALFFGLSLNQLIGQEEPQEFEEISVTGSKKNKFKEDSSFVVGKLPLKDLENPQVYNSIPKELIKEQNVTEFNQALKNATGVTRLWESTGRGGDGAAYYSMRGFSVQPLMINGLPSVTNGVIDPSNVESIQVIKGPSGTLFGSPNISYGGLINVTTKRPYDRDGGAFSYTLGNYGLNRITLDINESYSEKAAVRLNGAFTNQNSFQDAGFNKSYYLAPSFKFKPTEKMTVLINSEFNFSESSNAPMIFLTRNSPLAYQNMDLFDQNYRNSYTSNDLTMDNQTFGLQGQVFYEINDHWTSQTAVSSSLAGTDGYYQYLWDLNDGENFIRYMSKRNGQTQTTDIQQNFIGNFNIGSVKNKMVIGIDYYRQEVMNSSTGWVGNGIVNLRTQEDSGRLTSMAADSLLVGSFEGQTSAVNEIASAYISNVTEILPNLSVMLSARIDQFMSQTDAWTAEGATDQLAVSPKFGIVYQPVKDKVALFANYMNGFSNVAPAQVADADGSNVRMKNFDPEQANQYEAGVKTDIWKNKLALTASYYIITVSNKLMQDPENVNNQIQGGEVVSQGVELSLVASPIRGMNIVAGFSHNDAEVTEDNPDNGYLGFRPEEAGPAQLANFYVSYVLPKTKLRGLGIGFGGNIASEHHTLNREVSGTFTLPAYQIFNASVMYRIRRFDATLRMNNLLNDKYYSGWSTINPQQLRGVSLKIGYRF